MSEVAVELTGDSKQLEEALDKSHSSITTFGKGALSLLGGVAVAAGALFAGDKILGFATGAISAAKEAEVAQARLAAVVKTTGGAAGFTAEQMGVLADDLETMSGISGETVQHAQALIATFKNVRGDQFKEATVLAADMAAVLGTDLKGSAVQVAKALNDPIKGVSALADAGVSFTEQQKEMIKSMIEAGDVVGAQKVILQELQGEFGGAAKAVHEADGPWGDFVIRMGRLQEAIGNELLPILDLVGPILDGVADVVERCIPIFVSITKAVVDFGKWAIDSLKPVFDFLIDTGAMSLAAFDVAIENWADIFRAAFLQAELNIVSFYENLKHAFTEVAPAYLKWLSEEWMSIFIDMGEFEMTVLKNMGKNLYEFFDQIVSWLRGDGFNFEWTGLTEGFKRSTKELPTIAARQKSSLEQSLGREIGDISESVADKFGSRMGTYQKIFRDMIAGPAKDAADATKDITDNASDVYDTGQSDKKDKGKAKVGSSVSLEELQKRIQEAAFGGSKDPAVKAAEKTADKTADVEKATKEAGRETKQELAKANTHLATIADRLGKSPTATYAP